MTFYNLRLFAVFLFLVPAAAFAQTASTTPLAASTTASTTATTTQTVTATTTTSASTPMVQTNAGIEAMVRSYFANIPVMIPIAKCESGFRQFNSIGQPLTDGSGTMIGIFQISRNVHYSAALSLGYDINTALGNIGYAQYLYNHSGTDPWISSFPCWSSSTTNPESATTTITSTSTLPVVATALPVPPVSSGTTVPAPASSAPIGSITLNLSFGMNDPQVITLQKILNGIGYMVATSGAGSPGNETTLFGNFTRASVRAFQCAKGIVCSGDEASTGYGYVGARTRAALLAASSGVSLTNTAPTTSSPAPTSSSTANTSSQIASLKAQIANYQSLINQLNMQVAALQAGQ